MQTQSKVLQIKIGRPQRLTFADGSTLETAIRKQPVEQVFITTLGPQGNDVGLKAHHGGVDKAVFFMGESTFEKLNRLSGERFDYQGTAVYGENFVLSGRDEQNVCIGDIYQIGEILLEVSQPRRPCSRLSKNTNNAGMQDIIYESGLTGWYVRVLKEGTARRGDNVILLERKYPQWTIQVLNGYLTGDPEQYQLEALLSCAELAPAFKRAVEKKLKGESTKVMG
ncbi:MOSC domain-containing protein [Pasteurellaceae bacterium LIM206]|nr:MOSC domain-containing protein [Pasteurellaceae bacterium LIM206]